MQDYERILVFMLGSFLALSLILAIFVLAKLLQILNAVKRITDKAESVADKVEDIGHFFQKTAGPAAIGKLLLNFFHVVKGKKTKSKRRKEDG